MERATLQSILAYAAILCAGGMFFLFLNYSATQNDPVDSFRSAYRSLLTERASAPHRELSALLASAIQSVGTSTILSTIGENQYCHEDAHELGKFIYTRTGKDLAQSFAVCGDLCADGCYHGAIMAAFRPESNSTEHVSKEEFAIKIDSACEASGTSKAPEECAHAVGHGLYVSLGVLEHSLELCKHFTIRGHEYFCATGVFMQRDIESGKSDLDSPDVNAPCSSVSDTYSVPCWRYKVSRLVTAGRDAENISKLCRTLAPQARIGCFHGLGLAYYHATIESPRTLARVCALGTSTADKLACIDGAMENVAELAPLVAPRACNYFDNDALRNFCSSIKGKEGALERETLKLYYP